MKKLICIFALLLLTGCSAEIQRETISDTIQSDIFVWKEDSSEIKHRIPEGMVLEYETEGEKLYTDGRTELSVRCFQADTVSTAVKLLSGYEAEKLRLLRTEHKGLPRYHFAWYAAGAEGERLSRASLIMDGTACYAMVSTVAADVKTGGEAVISSFGLHTAETV